jgi:hypothetical protein
VIFDLPSQQARPPVDERRVRVHLTVHHHIVVAGHHLPRAQAEGSNPPIGPNTYVEIADY